ncbi:MAG: hypothetical protein HYV09_05270 [Deltaproteobacteria bacterium]|nr:hypothetical protein [Deltaproteobacteria bacterium]
MRVSLVCAWLLLPMGIVGCEAGDPTPSSALDATDGDAASPASCAPDRAIAPAPAGSCPRDPTDFVPGSETDGWPACVVDDGLYHPFSASVASLTRVEAFERIASILRFGGDSVPTGADFVEARAIYSADEGIGSRVVRREDEHYPPAAKACRDMNPDEIAANADRCVGPAKILPILTRAFADGANGVDPLGNAARIEAALLWFFYVSAHKEATTCASKAADCDSMWAKYSGGEPRTSAKGLSRYVRARSPTAHDRAYDGLLAVRCWRDLDNPSGVAADLATRDRARTQLDRALLRGLAVIVRQRSLERACGGAWQGVRVLGAVLDRAATARDAAKAAVLRAELAKTTPDGVDQAKLLGALDALFPCP